MNNLVGLLSYMVAGKKVDQVNNVNLTLQYIVIHTSCTFADALPLLAAEQRVTFHVTIQLVPSSFFPELSHLHHIGEWRDVSTS